QRHLSLGNVGCGPANRPAGSHQRGLAGADLLRRIPAGATAAGIRRRAFRHPLVFWRRHTADRHQPAGSRRPGFPPGTRQGGVIMQPHQRIYGIFFVFALSMGALLSRLPDLQIRLELSEGQLGLLLLTMSVGALIGLTLSSPFIERLGARTT